MGKSRVSVRNKQKGFYHLHPELIELEILTRLPVKSLVRFQSVCKSWNLLISKDHNFIKSHLAHNPNYDSLIIRSIDHYNYPQNSDSLFRNSTVIIGCTNGLVCFYNWRTLSDPIQIGIWNPATKKCMSTSLPKNSDERLYSNCFGFTYDFVADDYKVMYLTTIEQEPVKGCVYSCRDDKWTEIPSSNLVFHGDFLSYRMSTIVNGSPYWLTYQPYHLNLTVMSFDVQHLVPLLLPQVCSFDSTNLGSVALVNMRDSVAVMVYDECPYLSNGIDVYVFDERSSVWRKTFIQPFISKEVSVLEHQKLLQCFRNGDILFMTEDHDFYCFNPETQTVRSLGKKGFFYYCWSYTESLIFIDRMLPLKNAKEDDCGIFYLTKY